MQIKEAFLYSEKENIRSFLSRFELKYREDTECSLYIEENTEIVATVSYTKNIIMHLAVSPRMQGENVASILVSEVISRFRANGIFGYRVFTKPEYLSLFENMGMRVLIEEKEFVALEGGVSNINDTVNALVTKVAMELGGIDSDTAAIVINGNPFTEGHMALVEYALARHSRLLLFVLEENSSEFSFKERISLAFLATRPYADRVSVLPSTDYIVSRATFPDYFLHTADDTTRAYAKYDALIFEKYFMKPLGIVKRYFGTEESEYMKIYNSTMLEVLKDKIEVVDRFTKGREVISAKSVRALLNSGRHAEALSYIPTPCRAVFSMLIGEKYAR